MVSPTISSYLVDGGAGLRSQSKVFNAIVVILILVGVGLVSLLAWQYGREYVSRVTPGPTDPPDNTNNNNDDQDAEIKRQDNVIKWIGVALGITAAVAIAALYYIQSLDTFEVEQIARAVELKRQLEDGTIKRSVYNDRLAEFRDTVVDFDYKFGVKTGEVADTGRSLGRRAINKARYVKRSAGRAKRVFQKWRGTSPEITPIEGE